MAKNFDMRMLLSLDSPEAPPALEDKINFADPGIGPQRSTLEGNLGSRDYPDQDVPHQGWGLLVPQQGGDELLEALRPLRALREEQQGHAARVYRVPPGLSPGQVSDWVREHFPPGSETDPSVPRYLMLLGDPEVLPFELESALAVSQIPGRLSLPGLQEVRAYAEKVVRAERGAGRDRNVAGVGTALDGLMEGQRREALALAEQALVQPLLALLADELPISPDAARMRCEALGDRLDHPQALLAAAQDYGLLVSVSHGRASGGRGAWASPAAQRARQGVPTFGGRGALEPDAVARGAFLQEGAWLLFACCGAGTPGRSGFSTWFKNLPPAVDGPIRALELASPADGKPFVAALPQAALANPEGPLGVIAHVDLAFSYSFGSDVATAEVRPHANLVQDALRGWPLGMACSEVSRKANNARQDFLLAATELGWGLLQNRMSSTAPGGEPQLHGVATAALRALDYSAFILLGDPAARLKLRQAAPQAAADLDMQTLLGFAFSAPAATRSAEDLGLSELERAIGEVLMGRGAEGVASALGVDAEALATLVQRYRAAGRGAIGR